MGKINWKIYMELQRAKSDGKFFKWNEVERQVLWNIKIHYTLENTILALAQRQANRHQKFDSQGIAGWRCEHLTSDEVGAEHQWRKRVLFCK